MRFDTWWSPIGYFATHTMVNSTVFVIVALPAVGLSVLVGFLSQAGVSSFVMHVFTFLEYSILIADSALFIVWLLNDIWEFIAEIRQ